MPRATADRPLTVKQTKFAATVAAGTPKAAAHRATYDAAKWNNPGAQARRASAIAGTPNVAAEIRRLTWLSCPPVADTAGMREHAVRVLSDLSRSAVSEEVRLKSALALFRIAETTRAAAAPGATDSEQDRLLASLRRLYVEVQGTAEKAGRGDIRMQPGEDPLGPEPGPYVPDLGDEPIDITALVVAPRAAAQEPPPAQTDPAAGPGEELPAQAASLPSDQEI